jgi:hypothetical protein
MIDFLENNGFWGVLLFSSYPNALFDMCGLCCGHSMMPMWKFLIAVSIGKGFIKAPMQELLFVWVFSHGGKHELIDFAKRVLNFMTPLPQTASCSTAGIGAECTPGGILVALAMFFLTRYLSKLPKMMLIPIVMYAFTTMAACMSVASLFQERFRLVDQMDKGLDKVLDFCTGVAKEQPKKDWLGQIMSYLSPKALFGYFVVGLVMFFVLDTINKLAQGHAKDELDKKTSSQKSRSKSKLN